MLAALLLGFTLLITNSTGSPDLKQAERIRNIEDSLLSPCCYGGQVSTHMSEIAAQMRQEITQPAISFRHRPSKVVCSEFILGSWPVL